MSRWWIFLAAFHGAAAQLSSCTSDVVRYMEKMQVSFMSAATEAADYLPISRCDCILDEDTKETPLHRVVNLASHGGVAVGPFTVVIEALLAKHGDLSAQDHTGATPLHLAAFHGQATAMSVLAWAASRGSQGALIFGIKDAQGLTALAKALKAWKVPTARILALSGAPAANATVLIECRPDLVEAVLQTNLEALSNALAVPPVETAGNCLVPPNSGRNSTLLHLAAELSGEDHGPEAVRKLLDAGAKVELSDSNGDTALSSALREDSTQVVSMMLAADGSGTLLSQTNRQGQSPLHIAAASGASNSLRLLVVEGADTAAKDARGRTPLEYAQQRGDVEAVESISMGSTLKAVEDKPQGSTEGFKSSGSWSDADERAAQALEGGGGLSTELIAAVIVAVAAGGLCLVLIVCMLRRRFGRRKRSMVAQEAHPERRKQVWTEQTEALPKSRTLSNKDPRRDSNEVHELPGSSLKAHQSLEVQTTPSQSQQGDFPSLFQETAETPKARNGARVAKKGKVGQGPRQAAKAADSSPAPLGDHRPQRKAKAKSRAPR